MVRFPGERNKASRLSSFMRRFLEIIEELELRDLPLQGGLFTRRGGLNNQSQSRLDRFLVYKGWECHFNGAIQCLLLRPVSDHFPIVLDRGGLSWGVVPFQIREYVVEGRGF